MCLTCLFFSLSLPPSRSLFLSRYRSLSLCISLSYFFSLCLCPSIPISVSLFSFCLSFFPVCLSPSLPLSLSFCFTHSFCLSLSPSLSLSLSLSLTFSLSFSLWLSLSLSTLKLFFNAHVKSHIDYASVVWGGCSDALKKRLNSLLRSGKLILPDKNLTTDQKLNKIGILNLHKQLDYNKGVFMYRALTNSAPVYISSLYKAPHSSSRNNYLQLPKPRIDFFKTSMAFSGALFWNSLPVHLRSRHSLSSFKRNLREHLNTTA